MQKTGLFSTARIICALLVLLFLSSCGDNNPLAPQDERAENEIWINDNGFEPATLTIQLGQTVIFTNKDDMTHAVQSGTPGNPTALFSTRNLTKNNSQTLKINQQGTFVYHDVDSHATGTIIIL